jgi:hypothetical protein
VANFPFLSSASDFMTDRTEIINYIFGENGPLEKTDTDTFSSRLQNLRKSISPKDNRVGDEKISP